MGQYSLLRLQLWAHPNVHPMLRACTALGQYDGPVTILPAPLATLAVDIRKSLKSFFMHNASHSALTFELAQVFLSLRSLYPTSAI